MPIRTIAGALLAAMMLAAAPPAAIAAAEPAPPVNIFPPVRERTVETHALTSREGLAYSITISRPAGSAPASGFPVAYVVDGNAWFGVTAEIARLNDQPDAPMVVVGIGYPTRGLFDMPRRVRDFTRPAIDMRSDPRLGPLTSGGAEAFMTFLRDGVKPFVAGRMPIDAKRQVLVGHSLGGLFVLEQMFADPGAFQAYVAASPAIHFDNRAVLARAAAFARAGRSSGPRLFVGVGSLEQDTGPAEEAKFRALVEAHKDLFAGASADDVIVEWKADRIRERMVDNARDLAAELSAAGVETRFSLFEGEDHLSAAVTAVNRAIPFVQDGWR